MQKTIKPSKTLEAKIMNKSSIEKARAAIAKATGEKHVATKDEALRLALDALEFSKSYLDDLADVHGTSKKAKPGSTSWHVDRAIAACREALAQKDEQEPVAIGTEWMPCVKLPIVVHVREQREGESHVSTREGITPVKHDDLIMRGVEGEEYPIGRALFDRTYTFPPTNTKSASR